MYTTKAAAYAQAAFVNNFYNASYNNVSFAIQHTASAQLFKFATGGSYSSVQDGLDELFELHPDTQVVQIAQLITQEEYERDYC